MLDTPEIARRLACSLDTVQRLIKRGDLPAYRVGRRWRVKASDLAAYLEAGRVKPSAHAEE